VVSHHFVVNYFCFLPDFTTPGVELQPQTFKQQQKPPPLPDLENKTPFSRPKLAALANDR
jgi:hypothetical protein